MSRLIKINHVIVTSSTTTRKVKEHEYVTENKQRSYKSQLTGTEE